MQLFVKTDLRFLVVLACFALSGTAGLVLQTAWLQQFALVFGTSELALVTVLAAYMAGLALGAVQGGRWAERARRPVLLYAGLELGIGASAVLVPTAIELASRVQVAWLGGVELPTAAGSTGSALFYLLSSFLILLVPTGLMGATLPLLARWAVRTEDEIGRRIGLLYAANTLGAAGGTLIAAYLLLPWIGLDRTVWFAAATNALVSVLALAVARNLAVQAPNGPAPRPRLEAAGRSWILPVMAVSGAVSFTWEILWTRLLSHLVGGSIYAFATMLATMLLGLTLGSALAAAWASSIERARNGFAVAQIAIGGLSLVAFALVDHLPAGAARLATGGQSLSSSALLSAATLLPGAIAIGATFPLAVRYLAADPGQTASASARILAWNTTGAIAGALLAGYLFLPTLGFAGAAALAAAGSFLLALSAAARASHRRVLLPAILGVVLLSVTVIQPATPWTVLRHGPLGHGAEGGEVAFHAVGRSATVMLFERPGEWTLTTNGLPESAIDMPSGRAGNLALARWLSLLPVAARPDTRSLVVVGLGAGVTVEEVPTSVEEIHVVELEQEVVEANLRIRHRRRKDPFSDPRVVLHVNDARGALRLTERRYDAIASQPSHPWTSGASHLFTREFVELVRDRLTPTGVFVQWMGLPFVDEELLRAWVATSVAVFPYVELYAPGPDGVLLLASGQPLELVDSSTRALERDPATWARHGLLSREDLLAARVLDSAGAQRLSAGIAPITDGHNRFQTRAPTVLGRALGAAGAERVWAPYLPDLAPLLAEIDVLYLLRRTIRQGQPDRARRLAETLDDPVLRLTGLGWAALAKGHTQEAESALRRAVALDPESTEARVALLALQPRELLAAPTEEALDRLSDRPERAVIESWRALAGGDWEGVRALDPELAAVGFRHPFHSEAVRLRAAWRAELGDPQEALEATAILEPILSPLPRVPDLLLRARAAAAGRDLDLAQASLVEAGRGPRGAEVARLWQQILAARSGDQSWPELIRKLEDQFRRPLVATVNADGPP